MVSRCSDFACLLAVTVRCVNADGHAEIAQLDCFLMLSSSVRRTKVVGSVVKRHVEGSRKLSLFILTRHLRCVSECI